MSPDTISLTSQLLPDSDTLHAWDVSVSSTGPGDVTWHITGPYKPHASLNDLTLDQREVQPIIDLLKVKAPQHAFVGLAYPPNYNGLVMYSVSPCDTVV